jgi:sugar phosphate permease
VTSADPGKRSRDRGSGRQVKQGSSSRPPDGPSRIAPQAYFVFVIFVLAYFFSYFYRSANAVIADDLAREMGLGAAQLGLMTSLFFMAFAAAQVPLGAALDRFGSRFVTSTLMLSAVLGSLLFAVAQDFALLALGRALMGLGMAGVLMGSLKAFSGWFPPRKFATISGLFLGLGSLGALAASTPLAALNEAVGWRVVFLGGAALVLLTALGIAAFGRQAPLREQERAGTASAPETSTVSADGPAGAASWSVFASPVFWRIGLLGFAVTGSMFAYQGLWAGPYLVEKIGLSPLKTGNLLLLLGAGVSGGYMIIGWVADRLGLARVTFAGSIGMVLVQLSLAFFPAGLRTPGVLALLFLLLGFFGSFSVLFFAHVRLAFPLHMTGRALTAVNLMGIGGSALLQWLLGVVIGGFGRTAEGMYPPEAYSAAFLVTAGLIAVALFFYWPLLAHEREQAHSASATLES